MLYSCLFNSCHCLEDSVGKEKHINVKKTKLGLAGGQDNDRQAFHIELYVKYIYTCMYGYL